MPRKQPKEIATTKDKKTKDQKKKNKNKKTERQIPYHITYIWNLIYSTNEPFHRKENLGLGEETCGCQGGGEGSGIDWEIGVNTCRLLLLERISNGIPLYGTGNYIWSLVMEHDDVRKKNVYIYV